MNAPQPSPSHAKPIAPRLRVLCVDDEPAVLEGIEPHLRKAYVLRFATSGEQALAMLDKEGPFAIVLSDMRMPGMNGASLLAQVRRNAPHTVRLLLTGQTDMESAVAAVNEGQIFRFLTKPCPPEQLVRVFAAAAEQHQLLTAERELLEKTVRGSIKALTELLSLSNPLAFGRATRVSHTVEKMCEALQIEGRWVLEVAAMISPLGTLALSDELAEKYHYGHALTLSEQQQVAELPLHVQGLVAHIPRLEAVLSLLKRFAQAQKSDVLPQEEVDVQILALATKFDEFQSKGMDEQSAINALNAYAEQYQPGVFQSLVGLHASEPATQTVREMPFSAIREGMVFAQDVRTSTGLLLVARGHEVTASFVARARSFNRGFVSEPVRMIVPAPE